MLSFMLFAQPPESLCIRTAVTEITMPITISAACSQKDGKPRKGIRKTIIPSVKKRRILECVYFIFPILYTAFIYCKLKMYIEPSWAYNNIQKGGDKNEETITSKILRDPHSEK